MDVSTALTLSIELLQKSLVISRMVASVQSQGRQHFTADEWATITKADDLARQRLVDEIGKAKQRGQ